MKEWLITDTHFDHDNIGVYCDRPDGWMDRILVNWKRIVQDDDIVIHLGDVQVGNSLRLRLRLDNLPGRKILVRGNHDTHSLMWYMRNGFSFATDALAYKGVTITHKPSSWLFPGTDINLHGHVHNSVWTPTASFQRRKESSSCNQWLSSRRKGDMKTIYLCGGINKLSDSDAKDWREAAKSAASRKILLKPPETWEPHYRLNTCTVCGHYLHDQKCPCPGCDCQEGVGRWSFKWEDDVVES